MQIITRPGKGVYIKSVLTAYASEEGGHQCISSVGLFLGAGEKEVVGEFYEVFGGWVVGIPRVKFRIL